MLHALDLFLTLFHSAFVLFVLFGWASPKTRVAHITALLLTLIAWLLLGLYKGTIGYCPLTDWHWDIKRALGEHRMPASFIEYMVEKILGINFSSQLINVLTLCGLIFGMAMAALHPFLKATDKAFHRLKLFKSESTQHSHSND